MKVNAVPTHTKQALMGERGIALFVLNLGAKKEWVVNATPRPALPRGKTPGTPRAGVWMGPEILAPYRNSNPGPSIPWRVTVLTERSRPL
jgi:hypothetical protein